MGLKIGRNFIYEESRNRDRNIKSIAESGEITYVGTFSKLPDVEESKRGDFAIIIKNTGEQNIYIFDGYEWKSVYSVSNIGISAEESIYSSPTKSGLIKTFTGNWDDSFTVKIPDKYNDFYEKIITTDRSYG